jgi:DNA-binding LacI/PurR family transcriptional regulator
VRDPLQGGDRDEGGPQGRRRIATMEEVAKVAGVSKATVSRVLNDSPRISEKTRARVREVVRALGYEPNYIARSLSKQNTHSIGVVLEDIVNPFFAQVAKGIETVLKAGGYTMVLTSSDFVYEEELELTRTLLRYKVDGILITPVQADSLAVNILRSRGVPFFIMNAKSDDPEVNWIDSDNRLGGYLATRHLLGLGHRRFLTLFSNRLQGTRDRLEGFKQAIAEKGLVLSDQILIGDATFREDGYRLLERFIAERGTAALPSAVVAVNDAVAIGAMECLFEHGVRIPADVSIIGYDDIYFASLTRVPLTTIHQSKFRMGEIAARGLLEMLRQGGSPAAGHHFLIHPKLVVRESCREPQT